MAPPSASMCLGNLTFSGEICFSRYTLSNGILDAEHLPSLAVSLEILDLFAFYVLAAAGIPAGSEIKI